MKRPNYIEVAILLTIFIFVLVANNDVKAGGGWPEEKGKGYYKLGQNWIVSSSFYGPNGDIVSIRTNAIYTTSLYGEYGFTNRLTGILYFPFFVRNILNEEKFQPSGTTIPGEALNFLGDTDIALKYGLIVNKPVVLSASLLFGLPLGKTSGGEGQILQTGDGEFNQMLRFDVSTSFYPVPLYASAYAGFNNRTENFSDEVRFGGEVGYTFFKKLITIVKVNVVQSLYNGSGNVAENGVFSNNTEYISPALEVAYAVTNKWGISASGGFAFSGKNILASPNWGVGLYLKR